MPHKRFNRSIYSEKKPCDGDSKMVFILLYWPNTKRYYDSQTFIPKAFTELDEKLMRSIGLQQ